MKEKLFKNRLVGVKSVHYMALIFVALLTTTACTAGQSGQTVVPTETPSLAGAAGVAIEEGVPGGIIVETFEASSKVISIDKDKCTFTLQDSEGVENEVKVGPEVVNFDQIQAGDMVTATVTKELIVQLVGGDETTTDEATGIVLLAEEGSKPAGVIGETIQITATVTEIDETNRTATLSLEDGTSKTLPIRDDIDLSQRKVGEKVVFLATEMIAISVE